MVHDDVERNIYGSNKRVIFVEMTKREMEGRIELYLCSDIFVTYLLYSVFEYLKR